MYKLLKIKKSSIYLILIVIISFNAVAQKGTVFSVTSDKGNLIRFWPNTENPQEFKQLLLSTRKFIIKRSKAGLGEQVFKIQGAINFPRKSSDFKQLLKPQDYVEFKKLLYINSDAGLDEYLTKEIDISRMSFFMEMKAEFLLAFGLAFMDNDVSKGDFFEYEVTREDKQGKQEIWGTTGIFSKEGNLELDRVKIALDTTFATDSLINFRWFVEIPDFEEVNFNAISDSTSKAIKRLRTYRGNNDYKQALGLFNRYSLNSINTNFAIYYRKNDNKDWTFLERQLQGSDSLTKAHIIAATIPCKPEDYVEAVIIPHDFVDNKGIRSEIARGMAISVNSVQMIYGLNARDSVNSIIIYWDKLPNKPYYSGIEIAKSYGNDSQKVVAILPPTAEKYIDTDIFPAGTINSYFVRPLFDKINGIVQENPATVIHSCTTFSKPSIPYNLKVIAKDSLVKITWDSQEDKAFHSYHVLRGTHPKKLSLISGNIHEKQFADTLKNLSSRLTYYYAVMAMNVMQDTSLHSEIVSFVSNNSEQILPPPIISFEVINKHSYLTWDDIKLNNVEIENYLLQKDEGQGFKTIYTGPANSYIDKTFDINKNLRYRAASISIKNDTSNYSPATQAGALNASSELSPVYDIKLIELENAVRVVWPAVFSGSITNFRIYRRLPKETSFKLVKEIIPGNFEYEDKDVKKGQVYVYSVAAVSALNKESALVEEQTIFKN